MCHIKYYLIIFSVLPLVTSCVTQKKRDDVSKVGKVYHDITSKYNRNFNANLLIDETLAQLDASYQEDYSEILPIYPFSDKENPAQLAEPMDRAIEKASVAISIHRPSHWTDDNYLIIGKAQYLKEDFESAEATFRYMMKHYDPDNLISASAQKSRNVNKKLSDREKAEQKKVVEKERVEKVKQRKKDIKKKEKERKKQGKKAHLARIKERKQEIKERQRLAKNTPSKTTPPANTEPDQLADAGKSNSKKERKPFDENPKLPKVKGNPDTYFLKHKPAHQDAQLWLAKTLIERDRFGEAENILRTLDGNSNTYKEIREEIYPVQAHSALSRGQTAAAVEPLRNAIVATGNRVQRARFAFILAQVLERTNQYSDALAAYDQVVKLRPDYEMSFNAQLSKLKMQSNTGSIDHEKYADVLKRMIKDDKNIEFQDQLYYALAQKDLLAGNKAEAIANLSESIRSSAGNQVQKAEAYYTIADLYFQDDEFVKAKYYYDSTLTVMNKNDERYNEVANYSKNLSAIASNLETIELQDSLIKISQLSDKELKALAAKIKKEAALAEAASKAAAARPAPGNNINTISAVTQNVALGQSGSLFFAYDDKAVKKGQRDFSRVWGDIALQDNWRRSGSSSFGVIVSESTGEVQETPGSGISETEIDEIFKDVPKTPAQMTASLTEIEDALFDLGQLFRSELSNSKKSVESLDKLFERFPSTEHALDAYYLLYVDHTELGQVQKADFYSKKILEEFADSEYAKYIKDPTYLQNALSDEEKVEKYYQEVHLLYENGEYDLALRQLNQSRNNLPAKHSMQSKFSLLTALCIGRLQGREPYVNALKELIAKYPKTLEEERAKEIIRLLGIRFAETSEGIEEINPEAYFSLSPDDKLHMVLILLKSDSGGEVRNQARIDISDYNKKYHSLDKLNVSMILLGENNDVPLIVVRRFDTREKAMSYYDGVQKNGLEFLGDPTQYEIYAASQTNYRKIVQLKSADLYRDFFVKEYLTK